MSQARTDTSDATRIPPCEGVVDRFRELFNQMSSRNLGDLDLVYGKTIEFTDPFTSVKGLDALREYFEGAYSNVIECRFEFGDTVIDDDNACLTWVMNLRHKRIRRGELIQVDGISRLRLENGRVILHRDYFDAGQLLYENLPVLGSAVRWLRKNAA
ncbi:MAG: nuclear transport factor 2 family protein [Oleiphilaceae bacterium]|nr:nuclear transport factor 2 family protein [Oleiphilaceae bacterium]